MSASAAAVPTFNRNSINKLRTILTTKFGKKLLEAPNMNTAGFTIENENYTVDFKDMKLSYTVINSSIIKTTKIKVINKIFIAVFTDFIIGFQPDSNNIFKSILLDILSSNFSMYIELKTINQAYFWDFNFLDLFNNSIRELQKNFSDLFATVFTHLQYNEGFNFYKVQKNHLPILLDIKGGDQNKTADIIKLVITKKENDDIYLVDNSKNLFKFKKHEDNFYYEIVNKEIYLIDLKKLRIYKYNGTNLMLLSWNSEGYYEWANVRINNNNDESIMKIIRILLPSNNKRKQTKQLLGSVQQSYTEPGAGVKSIITNGPNAAELYKHPQYQIGRIQTSDFYISFVQKQQANKFLKTEIKQSSQDIPNTIQNVLNVYDILIYTDSNQQQVFGVYCIIVNKDTIKFLSRIGDNYSEIQNNESNFQNYKVNFSENGEIILRRNLQNNSDEILSFDANTGYYWKPVVKAKSALLPAPNANPHSTKKVNTPQSQQIVLNIKDDNLSVTLNSESRTEVSPQVFEANWSQFPQQPNSWGESKKSFTSENFNSITPAPVESINWGENTQKDQLPSNMSGNINSTVPSSSQKSSEFTPNWSELKPYKIKAKKFLEKLNKNITNQTEIDSIYDAYSKWKKYVNNTISNLNDNDKKEIENIIKKYEKFKVAANAKAAAEHVVNFRNLNSKFKNPQIIGKIHNHYSSWINTLPKNNKEYTQEQKNILRKYEKFSKVYPISKYSNFLTPLNINTLYKNAIIRKFQSLINKINNTTDKNKLNMLNNQINYNWEIIKKEIPNNNLSLLTKYSNAKTKLDEKRRGPGPEIKAHINDNNFKIQPQQKQEQLQSEKSILNKVGNFFSSIKNPFRKNGYIKLN